MEEIFGPGGLFQSRLEGYEIREGQSELAGLIAAFLSSERRVFAAEAPTGTGKTYAVLAPALLWARGTGGRLLFLTSSVTLQEQLLFKDLPALQAVLGTELSCALLKGRSNYACLRKALGLGDQGFLSFDGDGGELARDVVEWAYSTEDGDLSELPLPSGHPLLERITSSRQTCLGGQCPYRDRCFPVRAMRRASASQVVVSNYHKYFAYRLDGEEFPIGCDVLICDEAHSMSSAARSVAAATVGLGDWQRLLRRTPPALGRFVDSVRNAGGPQDLMAEVAALGREAESFFELAQMKNAEGSALPSYDVKTRSACDELVAHALSLAEPVMALRDLQDDASDLPAYQWALDLEERARTLAHCCDTSRWPRWAFWRDGATLHCSPVTGAPLIAKTLGDERGPKLIALSATLTVDNGFEFWAEETGLSPDETHQMPSPFDLPSQMSIHVVDLGLPVGDVGYGDRVARVCRRYCRQNGGATLVLLSSRKLLRLVAAHLKERSEDDGYDVLVQGDRPQTELLEEFRAPNGRPRVLLGLASFREGIDVVGPALTQVIIDRIPFAHPDDPVVAARHALEGKRYFRDVELPTAKMRLRQALGRLIRSRTDRGRVIILDGRVLQKTAWNVPRSLPDVPIQKVQVVVSPPVAP